MSLRHTPPQLAFSAHKLQLWIQILNPIRLKRQVKQTGLTDQTRFAPPC